MGQFGIGQPVRRKEDVRLVKGAGQFTDDVNHPGQLWAAFVRSPHAHALIKSIDATAARTMPGVVDVITGAELEAAGVGKLITDAEFEDRSGRPMSRPLRRILPIDRARFAGECVAMVVADTMETAREAAEAVEVDYDPLPAIVATGDALRSGAPKVWPEFDSNLVVHCEHGDKADVEARLAKAARRARVELVNQRIAVSPMEPRVVSATFDKTTGTLTLFSPTQGGRRIQTALAKTLFKMDMNKVRVVSVDTGGGFGIRSKLYPETACVVFAARKLGRPVKWRGDRLETFMSDYHGRDQLNVAEMGLDETGRIIALHVTTTLNLGAYLSENGVRLAHNGGGRIIPGVYDVPAFYFSVKPVFTNTICTDTYRGAGRPEANYIMERLMDAAAEATGLTRDEIRRRNFVRPEQMPFKTQLGFVIDSGDFAGTMEMALDAADMAGFEARRKAAAAQGKLLGFGLAVFIEGAGSRPTEGMRIRIEQNGRATVFPGTYSHGQGHHTVYSQLLVDFLGVDFDMVDLVQGDTASAPSFSLGTFGSRSSVVGSAGLRMAADAIIAKGKRIAAHLMQSTPEQVTFEAGAFRTASSSMTLAEVARAAHDPARLPEGVKPGLDEEVTYEGKSENFPNGAHACEVEVDPELGTVEITRFVAVDDCGVVLNPFIVHGQAYGGIAQGLGQALTEAIVYDAEGQLLSASYMDYAMPRAHHMVHVEGDFNVIPCKTNPLGVKGAGEAGATGAPPAIVSAVVDALKGYGVRHIDMPLTPQRVWDAIQSAKG